MELITSVGIGVLLFGCFVFGYREGLRLGMRSAKGMEPKPLKSPVAAVKEHIERVEAEKKADEQDAVFDTVMNYDGYTDRERAWMKGERR